MRTFDIIASRTDFAGRDIREDSVTEAEMDTVVKVCRKHGVDFIFSGKGDGYAEMERFMFRFFVRTDPGADGADSEQADRLMDCIHELDLRTGLLFEVSYLSGSMYEKPEYQSGLFLKTCTLKPVVCCLAGGSVTTEDALKAEGFYDKSRRYLVITCNTMKPGDKPEKHRFINLGSAVSELYGRLVEVAMRFRADCRILGCPLEWLRRYVPAGGVVRAFRFGFGGCADVDDFSLSVVQYADGTMLAALVRSDGCADVRGCSLYMFDCVTMLAERYMSGELSIYPFGDKEREQVTKVVADNERKKMILYANERV